ncbi:MAG: MarR family winged helix-turn-helix transcriptional regulator [Mycobacterium sp.]
METDGTATLGYLLTRTATSLRGKVAARLEPIGLSLPEYICMQFLRAYPGMSNSELARQAVVTRQAMNAVLHRLEEEGLISRPENADHGRSLPARLTRRGSTQLDKAVESVTAAENEVMEKLGVDERKALKAMLAKCVPSQLP